MKHHRISRMRRESPLLRHRSVGHRAGRRDGGGRQGRRSRGSRRGKQQERGLPSRGSGVSRGGGSGSSEIVRVENRFNGRGGGRHCVQGRWQFMRLVVMGLKHRYSGKGRGRAGHRAAAVIVAAHGSHSLIVLQLLLCLLHGRSRIVECNRPSSLLLLPPFRGFLPLLGLLEQ